MRTLSVAGIAFFMCAPGLVRAQTYTVVELTTTPTLTNAPSSTVKSHTIHRINADGQSAGAVGSSDGSGTQAFFADPSGNVTKLGFDGGDYSEATAVNHPGSVVGFANNGSNVRAFLWNKKGFQDLGTLPGDLSAKAYDLNDQTAVVGSSSGPSGVHAFVWSSGSGMQSLIPSSSWSEAYSISTNGDIVGMTRNSSGEQAFYYSKGNVTMIPPPSGDTQDAALSISNNGQYVVGRSSSSTVTRAFEYAPHHGGMQILQDLAGGSSISTVAFDVNSAGTIVGSSVTPLGARATIWGSNGAPTDLNTLIPGNANVMLTQALSINDSGVILAVGGLMVSGSLADLDDAHHAGPVHSFLLIPTNSQ